MRIVDVNEFYSPTGGGVRTYLDRKMGIMADLGHELIVVAPWHEDRIEVRPDGGTIYWTKALPLIFDRNYHMFHSAKRITDLLDELKPDLVETSTLCLPAHVIGNWQGDAAKVFFAHGDHIGAYFQRWFENYASVEQVERWFSGYTRYMAYLLRQYDAFVTNGPELARRFSRRGLQVDASIPLGIEKQHFSPDLRDEDLRASLLAECGLPRDGHLLIGLGRHHPEKRWEMVIDAVQAAAATRPIGLIQLGDGILRKKLQQRVARHPNIRLFHTIYDREQLSRVLASCDALIHGSDMEPFGLVPSEALASGLPLIIPDEGGSSQLADPRYTEVYRARDEASASDAIHRLFSRDQHTLRQAAKTAAASVHTDRQHAIELMDFYGELCQQRKASRGSARHEVMTGLPSLA